MKTAPENQMCFVDAHVWWYKYTAAYWDFKQRAERGMLINETVMQYM